MKKYITAWTIANAKCKYPNKQANASATLSILLLLGLIAGEPVAAASYVTLGCTPGGSGTLQGCPATLNQAQVGTFSEPASFTYTSDDTFYPIYREVTGQYSQGTFSSTSLTQYNAPGSSLGIGSDGLYAIDGLTLSYTGSGSPTSADITMNLRVAGNVTLSSGGDGFASSRLGFSVALGNTYADPTFNYYGGYSNGALQSDIGGLGTQIANGNFAPSFDAIITTGAATINIGSNFGASFGFSNLTSIYSLGQWQYASQTISGSGWLPGMQVFNTPAGFYVNSDDGLIVNNVFMPSAVPLPAAAWLFGSGLIGLVAASRRRQPRIKHHAFHVS